MILHVFHHAPLKTFLFFFSNTLNKFQEWWHSWDPKEVIQCEENYICTAARRDYLIHPFTPKFPTKWPFQLDNILSSSMVLHTNLSIIYLFILECSSHLLSKYHRLDVVLSSGNIPPWGTCALVGSAECSSCSGTVSSLHVCACMCPVLSDSLSPHGF